MVGFLLMVVASSAPGNAEDIRPGERWLDNRGQQIQAHGGGVIRVKETYYWFGEDRTPGNDAEKRYVACYSSRDLVHWTESVSVFPRPISSWQQN